MREKLVLPSINPKVLIFNLCIVNYIKEWNGPHLNSIYLVIRLQIFYSPLIMWKSFMKFKSIGSNPPYIRSHVVFKMHLVTYPV